MKKHLATLSLILALLLLCSTFPVQAFADFEPDQEAKKVLVINFDPIIPKAGSVKQHTLLSHWNDPADLAKGFAADLEEISHGSVSYSVVDWIELDEMPMTTDHLSYDPDEYYETLIAAAEATDGAYWTDSRWKDWGFSFDYDYYMERFQVYDRVSSGEVDEVWIFAGPMVGVTLYETRMIGKDAYWCNSPGLEKDCKPFVVYGFNYERGVGEMLEDAGHRAESILNEEYGWPQYDKPYEEYTDWEKFTAYDLVSPGNAGVGNVHFAPNSVSDYDWGNPNYVYSTCNDWSNFPDMEMEPELVNCSTWGDGDIRLHHKWWFSLFPHEEGVNDVSGKKNNWWVYFTLDDLNRVFSFVQRCYSLILGRGADTDGLNNWTEQLTSGEANASEIISGFMNSQEYLNQNNTSDKTVEVLYNTMLGRESDPAGKQDWVQKLDASGSSDSIINGFCGSQEFLSICDDYGITAGSVGKDLSGLKGFVERCYVQALNRHSDENGFEYWYRIMENQLQTPQEVAAGFVYSQEMNAAGKIAENPDALLDSLYRLYLGREADEGGKEYWKQRIAEGLTLEELNYGFAYSAEFSGIVESYGLGE